MITTKMAFNKDSQTTVLPYNKAFHLLIKPSILRRRKNSKASLIIITDQQGITKSILYHHLIQHLQLLRFLSHHLDCNMFNEEFNKKTKTKKISIINDRLQYILRLAPHHSSLELQTTSQTRIISYMMELEEVKQRNSNSMQWIITPTLCIELIINNNMQEEGFHLITTTIAFNNITCKILLITVIITHILISIIIILIIIIIIIHVIHAKR